MHKLSVHKKIIVLLFSMLSGLFLFNGLLFADDFYWENPVALTDSDSRFPQTVTNGRDTYLFWQEVDVKEGQIFPAASITA